MLQQVKKKEKEKKKENTIKKGHRKHFTHVCLEIEREKIINKRGNENRKKDEYIHTYMCVLFLYLDEVEKIR